LDLQEECFCRNALQRLGAYNDEDDEVYLLQVAEAGNAVAQLAIADMCASPFDATRMHCSSSHYDVRCCADTTSGE
jgi:hypothetical protein